MGSVTGQCVGIDISEDFLDVYLHPAGKEVRFPHSDEGSASLIALLREYKIERVVLESTGGLQRRLVRALQEAGYAGQRGQPRADLGLSPPGRPGGRVRTVSMPGLLPNTRRRCAPRSECSRR